MPDERFDAIKEVLLRQLDLLEATVRALNPDIEDEELLQYRKRATQIISVIGEAEIVMDQKNTVSTGGNYVGRDQISQRAGRDMRGVAGGEEARSEYSESIRVAVTSSADLCNRINELADQVANGNLSAREKATLLPALLWWSEQAQSDERPDDAEEHLSPIATATQWVRDRVAHILSCATGAVASHWAIESVKRFVQ